MSDGFYQYLKNKYPDSSNSSSWLSVRVSGTENAALYDIADSLGCSRQDVVSEMIQRYVMREWLLLREEDGHVSCEKIPRGGRHKYVVWNTCQSEDNYSTDRMISDEMIFNLSSSVKEHLENIHAGDTVLLYASGIGVIASGSADGDITHFSYAGGDYYSQKLKNFNRLASPLPVRRIRAIMKKNLPWYRPWFELENGEAVIGLIARCIRD